MNWARAKRRRLAAARTAAAVIGVLGLLGAGPSPVAAEPLVSIELNKLEPGEQACQAYLVIENGTETEFESLKLDLVVFDQDLIIARRLAVETAPLRPGKTVVKAFPIAAVGCDEISRVLLNGVASCRDLSGERSGCDTQLRISSRAPAPFIE